jgi:hypothetical protein
VSNQPTPELSQEVVDAAIVAAVAHRRDELTDGALSQEETAAIVALATALRGVGIAPLDVLLDGGRRGAGAPGYIPTLPRA